jgi:chromate transport protein ChrA
MVTRRGGRPKELALLFLKLGTIAFGGPRRMRRSPSIGAFLDGVVIASLGLMAGVTWQPLHMALVDWISSTWKAG